MCLIMLVNSEHRLTSTFIPSDLVQDPISQVWLCKSALEAFQNLNKAVVQSGMEPLVLVSGYRPYTYQEQLYTRKTKRFMENGLDEIEAKKKASKVVALPGCSEHQLGLALDLTCSAMKHLQDPLIEAFENQPESTWLNQNAHLYGFILRYSKHKMMLTGIVYEPWHYRYVGPYHASVMKSKDLCLEEYIQSISH